MNAGGAKEKLFAIIIGDTFNPDIFKDLVEKQDIQEFYCKGYHPWKGEKRKCTQYPVKNREVIRIFIFHVQQAL